MTAPMTPPTGPVDRLGSMLDSLPERIAAAQRQAAEFAGRSFAGEAADGSASATVDGAGRVVAIALSPAAARQRMSNYTIGERIAEAVNAALDSADAAREDLLAGAVSGDDVAASEEMFAYRMDGLQQTLESVQARLQGLVDRAARPVGQAGQAGQTGQTGQTGQAGQP